MATLYEIMDSLDAHIYTLHSDQEIQKPFDCNKEGKTSYNKNKLNDFLFKYSATTAKFRRYRINIIENENKIIAYFSLAHDSLIVDATDSDFKDYLESYTSEESREFREEYCKEQSFPAIKIEHLAVDKEYQSRGIGECILKYIIGEIIENDNGYGCQYLTVDALNNSDTNKFYSKFGFQNVTNEDHCAPFRRMYYPLIDLF